ncbi:MAG TPA: FAD-binding oxidoreductase [Nitrospiraceae bacterium]|nr:FAD-binding oxidoreductase [Nitrospiraceae bacterium]
MPIQPFRARVTQIRNLTHDVREITLRLLEPGQVAFKAGQFISFEVLHPRLNQPVTRPYSIASPPSQRDQVTLLLNLIPNGPGSTYLFSLHEGDETRFKGVTGSFYLRDEAERDLLFVATGTGIAPIRSMLYDLLDKNFPRSITLFWGLRSQKDLYYQDELATLAKRFANFTAVTTLSRPENGWRGEVGRVTKLAEDRIASVKNLAVYLCGSSGMLKDVSDIVNKKGLCPIRREKWYDDAGGQADY